MGSDRAVVRDGPDLLLSVRVIPGATREEVVAEAGFIRVKVHEQAHDGKANKRLVKVLGKLFGVARSAVIIERGQTARTKTVRVRAPTQLPAFVQD